VWRTRFRSLNSRVEVVVELPSIEATVRALVSAHAPAGPGGMDLVYRFAPPRRLLRDGEELQSAIEDIDLPPIFEGDLYRELTHRAGPGWLLHAAALSFGDSALVLAGTSGSGKSTLARALLGRGARYLSDEFVRISAGGEVEGISRTINLSEQEAAGLGPGSDLTCYPVRALDGRLACSQLWRPADQQLCHQPRRLLALVRLGSGAGARPTVRKLSPGAALCELWPHSLRRSQEDIFIATSLLERHASFALDKGGLADTCGVLEELAGGTPV
jgi:hypothetical protein